MKYTIYIHHTVHYQNHVGKRCRKVQYHLHASPTTSAVPRREGCCREVHPTQISHTTSAVPRMEGCFREVHPTHISHYMSTSAVPRREGCYREVHHSQISHTTSAVHRGTLPGGTPLIHHTDNQPIEERRHTTNT